MLNDYLVNHFKTPVENGEIYPPVVGTDDLNFITIEVNENE